MQPSRLSLSDNGYFIQNKPDPSPVKKRSNNNNPTSIQFENSEKETQNRSRANDIFESKMPFAKKISSSDPEVKKHAISETPSTLITSSDEDSESMSPKTKTKRSASFSVVKSIKSAILQIQGQPKEEKSPEGSPRTSPRLSPRSLNEKKLLHFNALKKLSLPKDAKAISLQSFDLGKTVLQPNKNNDEKFMETYLPEGIRNPKICGEEMWRSMGSTKLLDSKNEKPIVDGTNIVQEEQQDAYNSIHMGKMLNRLFRHVSQSDDELIPSKEFGCSQIDAGNIGLNLASRLKAKEDEGLDPIITRSMLLVFGLGKQEFCWHPGTWTIPNEFLTVGGTDDLLITEYGPSIGETIKPLKYGREISIVMKKGGGLEYITEQPITFKDRASNKLLGTCRMQTTFVFNKNMDCIFEGQQTKQASII